MGTADSFALCPFFRCTNDGRSIGCEGPVEGATIAISFSDTKALRVFKAYNCDKWYKYCPIYYGLITKYGDEVERE